MGNNGEELKAFNVRDGYGIRCALTSDIEVAIITGRKAKLVEDRCATLGITHLYQGQSNKLIAFSDLLEKLAIAPENVAYVGDDLIDWPVMEKVGLSENFEEEVLKSDVPVLVDMFATWCGPCKMMAPVVAQLAEEYKGSVKVGKLDIDQNVDIVAQYKIMSVPTFSRETRSRGQPK